MNTLSDLSNASKDKWYTFYNYTDNLIVEYAKKDPSDISHEGLFLDYLVNVRHLLSSLQETTKDALFTIIQNILPGQLQQENKNQVIMITDIILRTRFPNRNFITIFNILNKYTIQLQNSPFLSASERQTLLWNIAVAFTNHAPTYTESIGQWFILFADLQMKYFERTSFFLNHFLYHWKSIRSNYPEHKHDINNLVKKFIDNYNKEIENELKDMQTNFTTIQNHLIEVQAKINETQMKLKVIKEKQKDKPKYYYGQELYEVEIELDKAIIIHDQTVQEHNQSRSDLNQVELEKSQVGEALFFQYIDGLDSEEQISFQDLYSVETKENVCPHKFTYAIDQTTYKVIVNSQSVFSEKMKKCIKETIKKSYVNLSDFKRHVDLPNDYGFSKNITLELTIFDTKAMYDHYAALWSYRSDNGGLARVVDHNHFVSYMYRENDNIRNLGHELSHLFFYCWLGPQMVLPGWFVEGSAETLGNEKCYEKEFMYITDDLKRKKQTPESSWIMHLDYSHGGGVYYWGSLLFRYIRDKHSHTLNTLLNQVKDVTISISEFNNVVTNIPNQDFTTFLSSYQTECLHTLNDRYLLPLKSSIEKKEDIEEQLRKINFDIININTPFRNNDTLLHLAVRSSNVVNVWWLLQNGARLDIKNSEGKTPQQLDSSNQVLAKYISDFETLLTSTTLLPLKMEDTKAQEPMSTENSVQDNETLLTTPTQLDTTLYPDTTTKQLLLKTEDAKSQEVMSTENNVQDNDTLLTMPNQLDTTLYPDTTTDPDTTLYPDTIVTEQLSTTWLPDTSMLSSQEKQDLITIENFISSSTSPSFTEFRYIYHPSLNGTTTHYIGASVASLFGVITLPIILIIVLLFFVTGGVERCQKICHSSKSKKGHVSDRTYVSYNQVPSENAVIPEAPSNISVK